MSNRMTKNTKKYQLKIIKAIESNKQQNQILYKGNKTRRRFVFPSKFRRL